MVPLKFLLRILEAKERGEFFNILDPGYVTPDQFDVFLADVTYSKLKTDMSQIFGVEYLSQATDADAKHISDIDQAISHGETYRTIYPCVVCIRDKAYWVFFIIDSGAPFTYLSSQACKVFGIKEGKPKSARLAGHNCIIRMSPSSSHFHDVNILGADFCCLHNITVWHDYYKHKATLYFGHDWEVMKKKAEP
ncbi:hypothetical protein VTN77DRAFT_6629 [Rasamsonia byssochlamydoides]|uniref:uncharacterized protein n=1 Tax=Rasamsonia byssochlamydoides TaxID=89139 RepID=UPI003743181B